MLHTEAGGEQTIRDWYANSSYAYHRHVRVTVHDESFEGVTRGMEPDGALRVEMPQGVMKSRTGDVTTLRATSLGDADR